MHSRMLRAGVVAALALALPGAASAAPYASRTLSQGTSGSDVKALQRYLDEAGFETTADGQFGPATARSVRGFETARQRSADGVATRSEQRLVRTVASQGAGTEPVDDTEPVAETEEAYIGSDGLAVAPASAPAEVQAIIAAGNEIATKPYKYGGGHARFPRDSGYDCSGSISYALHGADLLSSPLDSTGFMSWGERGAGDWVTIYANAGHAYMTVAGLRFDTSARKVSGNRWSETTRSARGYRVRHPEGL
jgi:peptidoglycan hydrolase-like protein with peptidoglycan-binding domain